MKSIFFSDIHLERSDKNKKDVLKSFVRDVCHDVDNIFILGDLFEFFYGYKDYIYPWYVDIINSFKELTEKGKKVFFLEGNHEFKAGNSLEAYGGIKCYRELTIDMDGKKVFLTHGNEFMRNNPLSFLKSQFIYSIMEAIGPILTWKVAMMSSSILSDKKKPYREHVKQRFRGYAEKKLKEGFDVVIFAHTHMPDMVEFDIEGTKKLYLNTGDLYKYHSYISYETSKGFCLRDYVA